MPSIMRSLPLKEDNGNNINRALFFVKAKEKRKADDDFPWLAIKGIGKW